MFVLLRLYLAVLAVPIFPPLRLIEFILLILSVLFEVEDATLVEHQLLVVALWLSYVIAVSL